MADRPHVVILRMRQVRHIDASGIQILEELVTESKKSGALVIFSAVSGPVREVMQESGFVELVGAENFAEDVFAALSTARRHLGHSESENEKGRPDEPPPMS